MAAAEVGANANMQHVMQAAMAASRRKKKPKPMPSQNMTR
jgi:hypothetical protein